MPSITPYINWTVLFDYTGSVLVLTLTDTGTYPSGVPPLIKGNFTISQPDNLTRSNTDFVTSPDISWNGTSLPPFSIPLRLDAKGNVQLGVYTITYNVQAAGYDSGYLSRTFDFVLNPVTGIITANFDVFTPSLTATDATVYSQGGFTDAEQRTFTGLIQSNGVLVTSSSSTLDLKYNGSYYDSLYTLSLSTVVTYTGNPLSWLSAKMNVAGSLATSANTPPACSDMINDFTNYKNNVNASSCGCGSGQDVTNAQSLLNAINTNLANKNYTGLYNQVLAFENVITYGKYAYTNTGNAISPYVYNCGSGGSGGGSGSVSSVTVSFTVGQSGYNIGGTNTATFPSLATGTGNPKMIVIFTKGGTTEITSNYSFNASTGQISLLNGDIFNNGEQVYIFAIYNS